MQNYHIVFIIFTIFTIFTNWFTKSIFIIGLTAIITLISLPILSQDRYRTVENNLFATLKETGKFENLVAEIELAGLTEQLEKEQFTTLLAFRDEVFNALSDDIYDKFSQPENRKKVLRYHLITRQVTQEDLDRGKIVTAEGHTIAIFSHNGKNIDKVNDANAKFPHMSAINGVIIEIDQVLLPPDV